MTNERPSLCFCLFVLIDQIDVIILNNMGKHCHPCKPC